MTNVAQKGISRLVRPTLDTKYHIDYDWWERSGRDLQVYLRSHLCAEHQEAFSEAGDTVMVDHVDPETAQVTQLAGIQHILISHCAAQPGYITPQTSLVNAIFRVFLSNGNQPQTVEELGERLGRPPRTILRLLSGHRIYKGIRPVYGA
jgi:hypothetical protein